MANPCGVQIPCYGYVRNLCEHCRLSKGRPETEQTTTTAAKFTEYEQVNTPHGPGVILLVRRYPSLNPGGNEYVYDVRNHDNGKVEPFFETELERVQQ